MLLFYLFYRSSILVIIVISSICVNLISYLVICVLFCRVVYKLAISCILYPAKINQNEMKMKCLLTFGARNSKVFVRFLEYSPLRIFSLSVFFLVRLKFLWLWTCPGYLYFLRVRKLISTKFSTDSCNFNAISFPVAQYL